MASLFLEPAMYPTYKKGLIKPTYTIGGPPLRAPVGMYGELTTDQKRAVIGAAGVGVVLLIATTWTFVVGPWAVKQFKPEWGYGKRLVTSFLAGTLINFARQAITPSDEV